MRKILIVFLIAALLPAVSYGAAQTIWGSTKSTSLSNVRVPNDVSSSGSPHYIQFSLTDGSIPYASSGSLIPVTIGSGLSFSSSSGVLNTAVNFPAPFGELVAIGDSILQFGIVVGTNGTNGYQTTYHQRGYLNWFQAMTGYPFYFTTIYTGGMAPYSGQMVAVQGEQTKDNLARFDKYVGTQKPNVVFIHIGTNDIKNNQTADTVFGNIKTEIQKGLSYGPDHIVVMSIWPRNNSTGQGFTPTQETTRLTVNSELQSYLSQFSGRITFLSCDDILLDPNTGAFNTAYTYDGVHPNPVGSYVVAYNKIIPWWRNYSSSSATIPRSVPADFNSSTVPYGNIISNSQFTGSSGSKGSGVTGTVPTSWSSSRDIGSTVTAVSSVVAQNNWDGNPINFTQLVLTGIGSGVQHEAIALRPSATITSNIVAGQWYVGEVEVIVSPASVNDLLEAVYMQLSDTTADASIADGFGAEIQSSEPLPNGNLHLVLRTPPIQARSTAGITVTLYARIDGTKSGDVTVQWGQPYMVPMTSSPNYGLVNYLISSQTNGTTLGNVLYRSTGGWVPDTPLNAGIVSTSTTVNGHALSSNVTISASDLTTGVLPSANGGSGSVNGILYASGTGNVAPVIIGSNLTFSGGTLSATGGGGSTNPGGSNGNIQYNSGGSQFAGSGIIDSSANMSSIGTIASGAHTITSASSGSLLIGPNGATNPVLTVDSSTGSQADGLSIKGGVSGGGVTLIPTSPSSTSGLIVSSKSSANVSIQTGGSNRLVLSPVAATFSPSTASTASAPRFSWTGAADTGLTALTEAPEVSWALNQTRQHATGALALQRDFRIQPTTHSFAGSSTLTDAATLAVDSGPIAGTNATITNSAAIYVSGGALSGTVKNGYGLLIANPTGATNNYPAKIGSVVFDSTGVMTGAAVVPSVSTKTGAYTFVLSDNGQYVKYSSSGSATWTIPPHSSVAYPIGAQLGWGAWGGGVLTVQGGSGVQLTSSSLKYASQGGFAIQTTQDNWDIYGGTQ